MPRKAKKVKFIEKIRDRFSYFTTMFPKVGKAIRWGGRFLLFIAVLDLGYMIGIWPEWKWYVSGDVPKSRFIHVYERQAS